jgi:phenylalanyl-tRNA synthetase beta chain
MNIQILHSWLTEYIQTDATPEQIAQALALCGPSVETVNATQSTTKNGKPQKDWVYDIEITTNRVDMMSVIGVAREAAAILPGFGYKTTYTPLKVKKLPKPAKELPLTLKHDPKLSGRVMALVMDNIKVSSSPKWLQDRLEAAGIRSLNNIIDITNYIQPTISTTTASKITHSGSARPNLEKRSPLLTTKPTSSQEAISSLLIARTTLSTYPELWVPKTASSPTKLNA